MKDSKGTFEKNKPLRPPLLRAAGHKNEGFHRGIRKTQPLRPPLLTAEGPHQDDTKTSPGSHQDTARMHEEQHQKQHQDRARTTMNATHSDGNRRTQAHTASGTRHGRNSCRHHREIQWLQKSTGGSFWHSANYYL